MPKPTKPSAIAAAPAPPIRGVDPRTIFATKSAVWIDYQYNDLWPYMTAVVDYADLSNDYVDAQLTLVTDQASAASVSAGEALDYRNESEVFKNSAEAAAAAAQAGAGLPTVGNVGDSLQIVDESGNVGFRAANIAIIPLITETLNADSAVEFVDIDSYDCISFIVGASLSFSNQGELRLRTSSDNGVSFDSLSGDYYITSLSVNSSTATPQGAGGAVAQLSAGGTGSVGETTDYWVEISSLTNPISRTKTKCTSSTFLNGNVVLLEISAGARSVAETNNALQVYPSSGTMTGTVTLYGVLGL